MNKKIERDTKQRTAINAVMDAAQRPLNVKEIHEEAGRKVPNLGIATVYRNLKAMLAESTVAPVEGVSIPPCYARPMLASACNEAELFQEGSSLYLTAPVGFVRERTYRITTGRIGN